MNKKDRGLAGSSAPEMGTINSINFEPVIVPN
jgi:hypothetical protein